MKTFKVTLTTPGGVKVVSIVKSYTEDNAMDIALSHYEGLEVYDTELL